MSMKNEVLAEFQNYLRANSLVQEKYIPYYSHWARSYLVFTEKHSNLNHDLRTQKFLDFLKAQDNISDWQVKQANRAITLIYKSFSGYK
jgi:hypothetical protein